ncbi:MAG: hypothetical protein ABUK20_06755, partial [Anaerolineales bacterium]
APLWGAAGDHFIVPAPPSEWLSLQSIYARVPKPGSVQFALYCPPMEEKRPRNEIKGNQGVCTTLRLRSEAELPDSTYCRSVVDRPWIDQL